jgi:hypothetical protein
LLLGTINSTQAYQKCYDSSRNFSELGTPSISVFQDVRNYKNPYRRILLGTTKPLFTKNSYNTEKFSLFTSSSDCSGNRRLERKARSLFLEFLTYRSNTIQFSKKANCPKDMEANLILKRNWDTNFELYLFFYKY